MGRRRRESNQARLTRSQMRTRAKHAAPIRATTCGTLKKRAALLAQSMRPTSEMPSQTAWGRSWALQTHLGFSRSRLMPEEYWASTSRSFSRESMRLSGVRAAADLLRRLRLPGGWAGERGYRMDFRSSLYRASLVMTCSALPRAVFAACGGTGVPSARTSRSSFKFSIAPAPSVPLRIRSCSGG